MPVSFPSAASELGLRASEFVHKHIRVESQFPLPL